MGRLGGNRDKSPGLLPRSGKLMSFVTLHGLALSSNMCGWIEITVTWLCQFVPRCPRHWILKRAERALNLPRTEPSPF
jgi:hypothetical protein